MNRRSPEETQTRIAEAAQRAEQGARLERAIAHRSVEMAEKYPVLEHRRLEDPFR